MPIKSCTEPEIEKYCEDHSSPLGPAFDRLREVTQTETTAAFMQVGLLEGSFLQVLVRLLQPQFVLELGTFTGYSALAMAQALPPGARLVTCDTDPRATALALRAWQDAGVADRIELKLGPALQSLKEITDKIDLAFIDADKANYIAYWEEIVPKLSDRGLIVVDNVLWSGRILKPAEPKDHMMVNFNRHAAQDVRMRTLMLPIRDGILLAYRGSSQPETLKSKRP